MGVTVAMPVMMAAIFVAMALVMVRVMRRLHEARRRDSAFFCRSGGRLAEPAQGLVDGIVQFLGKKLAVARCVGVCPGDAAAHGFLDGPAQGPPGLPPGIHRQSLMSQPVCRAG